MEPLLEPSLAGSAVVREPRHKNRDKKFQFYRPNANDSDDPGTEWKRKYQLDG